MYRLLIVIIAILASCKEEVAVHNYKDLNQNMMDLRIYQENLGEEIKNKNLNDATWLLEGMDSILLILNKNFKEHRKMAAPFSHYYKNEMEQPIKGIRSAIKSNDPAKALNQYRILVNNCNDCHKDNDINKEVKF